tara:strand:- start:712 stop:1017 length:306 start_codon:yes stop_codon:yes gene_type:complete
MEISTMAEKKKAPAKKKAAPKAPAPRAEAVNPVGRPKNVVKLTETDLSYDMKSFISSVTSADLTSDDVALAALWLSMKQCQAVGPSVMSSRMRMICDSLNG